LERHRQVGGNAASFDLAGLCVDYGSHRLHPTCDPAVLQDIRELLGDDLLERPRHGRIRLQGRWIHFPLQPLDLCLKLPPSFSFGVIGDLLTKALHPGRRGDGPDTFASALERGLGRTICQQFYFPYACKVWGIDPELLSVTQAQRRVSAGSLSKMMHKALAMVPGVRRPGSGRFFYPRHGYGQISEAYSHAAQACGAEIRCNSRVLSVETQGSAVHTVSYEYNGQVLSLQADHVWSSIPITTFVRLLKPLPPPDALLAAENIDYRAMILVYLVLEQERFSEYDAHYFPEGEIAIARLSEPKNYSDGQGPPNLTVLCAELPCSPNDRPWSMSVEELGRLVCDALDTAGIPVQVAVKEIVVRRLRQAYPIYPQGYEVHFDRLDQWLRQIDGLLTFGRQGLFTHDNTHHALYMAYCAAECLGESGRFNRQRWQQYRRVFETHVVED
jgi:protoporphyrinogen oxidase